MRNIYDCNLMDNILVIGIYESIYSILRNDLHDHTHNKLLIDPLLIDYTLNIYIC